MSYLRKREVIVSNDATYEDFIKQDEKRSSDFEFVLFGNHTVVISKHSLTKEDSDIINLTLKRAIFNRGGLEISTVEEGNGG